MLRGPQTPGELKQRTERLHPLADLGAVHDALERLIGRGLAARLERRPGQKEERYVHLLGETSEADAPPAAVERIAPPPSPAPAADDDGLARRVARLEDEVSELRDA